MKSKEIRNEARKSANRSESNVKRDEWHSHYYGFILGAQYADKQHQAQLKAIIERMEDHKDR